MAGSDLLLAGVLFLFAAVIAVPLASRLGIGAVLGYLLAGIAIGPWGLGFISDVDEKLLRSLGLNVSCEPKYETKKLYHK